MRLGHPAPETPPSRETAMTPQKTAQQPGGTYLDYRRLAQGQPVFQQNQQIELATVPHNEYPTDGMTMFCRTDAPSERSSATSPARPQSRDSQSEYSNPTSFSSHEPPSGKQSPIKQGHRAVVSSAPGEKQLQKRRSGFFSNSPFRRKSKHDKDDRDQQQPLTVSQPASRNTWGPSGGRNGGVDNSTPGRGYGQGNQTMRLGAKSRSGSPEPVDPRANFQLNIGNNVFDVASPDKRNKPAKSASQVQDELDPIAQALAELKGVTKQSSVRMSADRYHGLATPAPTGTPSAPSPLANGPITAAQRGTPPPSYNDQPIKRLDLPQPAFTSAQMQQTTRKYIGQTQDVFAGSQSRPGTRGNSDIPRATSPAPLRSTSPRPGIYGDQSRQSQYNRSVSPNPYAGRNSNAQVQTRPRQSQSASPTKREADQGYGNQFSRHTSPNDIRRAVSPQPQPQYARQERPGSSAGMQLQLAPSGGQDDPYGANHNRRRPVANGVARPISYYGGGGQEPQNGGQASRVRSRSVADGRQFTRDGRPVLHYGKLTPLFLHSRTKDIRYADTFTTARALYMYQAAIPEELSFAKGDVLAVLRLQDDGWWEAEVTGKKGRPGLVPSNYLQNC